MAGTLSVLAKDVARLPAFTGQAPTRQNDVVSDSSSVEMEKPCAYRDEKKEKQQEEWKAGKNEEREEVREEGKGGGRDKLTYVCVQSSHVFLGKMTAKQYYISQKCNGKQSTSQCRTCGFNPWVGKISWRRKWQPIPVFFLGKSHGQRSLAGCTELDMN